MLKLKLENSSMICKRVRKNNDAVDDTMLIKNDDNDRKKNRNSCFTYAFCCALMYVHLVQLILFNNV